MLLTIMPPMSGSSAKPLCVAETPCTTCMYSGMNITTPRNAMLMTNDAQAAVRNVGCGTGAAAGSASVACDSTHRKTTKATAAAANNPTIRGESHG